MRSAGSVASPLWLLACLLAAFLSLVSFLQPLREPAYAQTIPVPPPPRPTPTPGGTGPVPLFKTQFADGIPLSGLVRVEGPSAPRISPAGPLVRVLREGPRFKLLIPVRFASAEEFGFQDPAAGVRFRRYSAEEQKEARSQALLEVTLKSEEGVPQGLLTFALDDLRTAPEGLEAQVTQVTLRIGPVQWTPPPGVYDLGAIGVQLEARSSTGLGLLDVSATLESPEDTAPSSAAQRLLRSLKSPPRMTTPLLLALSKGGDPLASTDVEAMALTVTVASEWASRYGPSRLQFLALADDSQVDVTPARLLGVDASGGQALEASFQRGYSVIALAALEPGESLERPATPTAQPAGPQPDLSQRGGGSRVLLLLASAIGGAALVAGSVAGLWWLRARGHGKQT